MVPPRSTYKTMGLLRAAGGPRGRKNQNMIYPSARCTKIRGRRSRRRSNPLPEDQFQVKGPYSANGRQLQRFECNDLPPALQPADNLYAVHAWRKGGRGGRSKPKQSSTLWRISALRNVLAAADYRGASIRPGGRRVTSRAARAVDSAKVSQSDSGRERRRFATQLTAVPILSLLAEDTPALFSLSRALSKFFVYCIYCVVVVVVGDHHALPQQEEEAAAAASHPRPPAR